MVWVEAAGNPYSLGRVGSSAAFTQGLGLKQSHGWVVDQPSPTDSYDPVLANERV